MNRSQRRRAAHAVKAKKKDQGARRLSAQARFEQDLRRALEVEQVKLISISAGSVSAKASENVWVLTIYAGGPGSEPIDGRVPAGRFITIQSKRDTLANIASGVLRVAREQLAINGGRLPEPAEKIQEPAPQVSMAEVDEAIRNAVPVVAPRAVFPSESAELSLAERIRRAQAGQP